MAKYLYGAAVQGIQGFIFQTNELKDIVGASELVEKICTELFLETIGLDKENKKDNTNAILMAAGNIKYIFESKKECELAVLNFPKKVMQAAPGITISQAVVEMSDKYSEFKDAVEELEKRLRTQRNKPMKNINLGLMGMLRSRKTGFPAVNMYEGDYLDFATCKKRGLGDDGQLKSNPTIKLSKKSFGEDNLNHENIAYEVSEMTDKNDWIAVIHADGNGLGQIVQKVGTESQEFRKFSLNLDCATIEAANEAFNAIKDRFKYDRSSKIPLRPVVLGGDDLTIICRADLAIDYTKAFLESFELKTKEYLIDSIRKAGIGDKLTACAGIAFIKSSYPFYYGYNLAESLCSRAKKDAKKKNNLKNGLSQSCLMFHKVQDSFIEDYDTIVKRELMPSSDISFEFGPYYLNNIKDRWQISDLVDSVESLKSDEDGTSLKSGLRQWMTILHTKGGEAAQQKLNRMRAIHENKSQLLNLTTSIFERESKDNEKYKVYPTYDILALFSINNLNTKSKIKIQ